MTKESMTQTEMLREQESGFSADELAEWGGSVEQIEEEKPC